MKNCSISNVSNLKLPNLNGRSFEFLNFTIYKLETFNFKFINF